VDSESDSSIADIIEPGLVSSSTLNSFVDIWGKCWMDSIYHLAGKFGRNELCGLALNSCELLLLDLEI